MNIPEQLKPIVSLSVWYGSMPESNGKTNWTAILHRKGECMSEGITIERSEYPERVRYEADRMRHLIGELEQEPDALAYDGDKHSGYVKPAHLTIPGALERDGDNGTHGADGESRADGESAQPVAYIDLHSKTMFPSNESVEKYLLPGRVATPLYAHADPAEVSRLRALLECSQGDMRQADQIMARQRVELDNLEQSRRSFFDLSQDLEKRLAERDALLRESSEWIKANSFGGCDAVDLWERIDATVPTKCESCGDWGHIETEDSAYDCPECGPSVVDRAVEAGVMNAPKLYAADDIPDFTPGSGNKARRRIEAIQKAKPKTCIECDQPYCHGVCVERGDQDYDRDQAAKGCDDE